MSDRNCQVPKQPNPRPDPTTANGRQVGGFHYKYATIQVWDAILAWNCGFVDGNVIKYVARYRLKGGLEDLLKAKHYLEKLIEHEETSIAAKQQQQSNRSA